MSSRLNARRAACAALLALGALLQGAAVARAQTHDNPNLPRSPYALPEPTYREPDLDELVNGNGKLNYSGQWRHWGDSRNSGELVFDLLGLQNAPGHTLAPRCVRHPEQC